MIITHWGATNLSMPQIRLHHPTSVWQIMPRRGITKMKGGAIYNLNPQRSGNCLSDFRQPSKPRFHLLKLVYEVQGTSARDLPKHRYNLYSKTLVAPPTIACNLVCSSRKPDSCRSYPNPLPLPRSADWLLYPQSLCLKVLPKQPSAACCARQAFVEMISKATRSGILCPTAFDD